MALVEVNQEKGSQSTLNSARNSAMDTSKALYLENAEFIEKMWSKYDGDNNGYLDQIEAFMLASDLAE